MSNILSIKDLHVDIGETSIVIGLNLEIESGETHAIMGCLLYTSPSPRDGLLCRMPSSA